MQLHHAVLFVSDIERSLAFYRDGLGLETLIDREFDGPWPEMFEGVTAGRLRAAILGDPEDPDVGQVELLTFTEPVPDGPPPGPPVVSSLMLSFMVDLEAVLPRLIAAGGSDVRRARLKNGYAVATLRDPDGILVEVLDSVPPDQRST
ncbi:MAG: VOC family protein [Frankiaceae bacterium]|nr:VOC family protein [Frankiaceae bacterium]MBV9870451.1 VOC family protein [Frankiaceae bacterium]